MTDRSRDLLELELENVVGDLVSLSKYRSFVEQVLSKAQGKWAAIQSLCGDWPEVDQILDQLDDDLQVSWLEHPQSKEFSLILFFRSNLWSKVATVNRKLAVKPRPVKARR
jgi:hypothetical protein